NLFEDEEHLADNSTNNVISSNDLDDRPSDEGFQITESSMMANADSSDEESRAIFSVTSNCLAAAQLLCSMMKTLLGELKIKFGGDCESVECFPSNPLRIKNLNYTEFNDDTDKNRIGANVWCHCGNCVTMPTNSESICCQEIQNAEPCMFDLSCLTQHKFFHTFCERSETVNIVLRTMDQNFYIHLPQRKCKGTSVLSTIITDE
ncbi:unnamed protein product, partial [Ranitomeya imitator]